MSVSRRSVKKNTALIKELNERGLLQDSTPGLEEHLAASQRKIYIGLDPTADSLHIGNLAALITSRRFQQAGHQLVVIIGGATGGIGDPSFKTSERQMLSYKTLAQNIDGITKQVRAFFEEGETSTLPSVEIINNYAFYEQMGVLDFLRDVGKHLTINYLLAKEGIKRRLETGISYTEFAYPLLQAYDYYCLAKAQGVTVQLGGSDQWGNLTTGVRLIKRKLGQEVHAATLPLLTRADGSKFGKSASGENIWLAPNKTSPYQFYQFWVNLPDNQVVDLYKKLGQASLEEINQRIQTHQRAPEKRLLQRLLAEEITQQVHGPAVCAAVIQISRFLFEGVLDTDFEQLPKSTWEALSKELPTRSVPASQQPLDLWEILTTEKVGLFPSRKAMRRSVLSGGLSINQARCSTIDSLNGPFNWLHGQYLLIRKGKKKYLLLKKTAANAL